MWADGRLELQLIRYKEGKFIGGVLELFNQKYGQSLSTDSIDKVVPGYSN